MIISMDKACPVQNEQERCDSGLSSPCPAHGVGMQFKLLTGLNKKRGDWGAIRAQIHL